MHIDKEKYIIILLLVIILLIISFSVKFFINKKNKIRFDLRENTLSFMLILYIIATCMVVFWPVGFVRPRGHRLSLIPFKDIYNIIKISRCIDVLYMLYLNILIFVPFGIILSLKFKNITLSKVLILGGIFSLFIEIVQFSAPYIGRVSCTDDIILNVLGTFVGYYCTIGAKKVFYNIKVKRGILRP